MSKGVLGVGCSFTWGEGLYFYSDLENLPFKENHEFIPSEITAAMRSYKDKHRYIQLVSDELNTWCHTNNGNGGSNWMSNMFLQDILDESQKCSVRGTNRYDDTLKLENYKVTDFDLLIYQFTNPQRNYHKYDGFEDAVIQTDKILRKFEDNGVKVLTISWDWEIPINSDNYKELFKHRHVDITYNGTTHPYFHFLTHDDNYNLSIRSDFYKQGLQKNDEHLNKRGHFVIKENIMNNL